MKTNVCLLKNSKKRYFKFSLTLDPSTISEVNDSSYQSHVTTAFSNGHKPKEILEITFTYFLLAAQTILTSRHWTHVVIVKDSILTLLVLYPNMCIK